MSQEEDLIKVQNGVLSMKDYIEKYMNITQEQEEMEEIDGDKDIVFKDMRKVVYDYIEDPPESTNVIITKESYNEYEKLREVHRMQLAAISTATFGYWKTTDTICQDYYTTTLADVANLYNKYDKLYKFKSSIFYKLYKLFN